MSLSLMHKKDQKGKCTVIASCNQNKVPGWNEGNNRGNNRPSVPLWSPNSEKPCIRETQRRGLDLPVSTLLKSWDTVKGKITLTGSSGGNCRLRVSSLKHHTSKKTQDLSSLLTTHLKACLCLWKQNYKTVRRSWRGTHSSNHMWQDTR